MLTGSGARLDRVTTCSNCGRTLEPEAEGEPPQPCPSCGATARSHAIDVADTVHASATATPSVERGLNDIRLAVLGIIVSIGLTVGFGVDAAWFIRCAAGSAAFVFSIMLLRVPRTRHGLMELMHRLSGS